LALTRSIHNKLEHHLPKEWSEMADERKETYPVIPVKHWWALRERFKQSIPTTVTPAFVATILSMKEQSARSNIIPSLVMMGIVDQDGKPTDRAIKWRDDGKYAEVCHEIRNEIYPQELLDAVSTPPVDRQAVQRWFANRTGAGEVAVNRFAAVYELLTTTELPKERRTPSRSVASSPDKKKPSGRRKPSGTVPDQAAAGDKELQVTSGLMPSIHIDIQIHISPEAGPDQIDQIFASMARHFRRLTASDE
jgi:hypothetical protein